MDKQLNDTQEQPSMINTLMKITRMKPVCITASDSDISPLHLGDTPAFTEKSNEKELLKVWTHQKLVLILNISCNPNGFLTALDKYISAIPENLELLTLTIILETSHGKTCNFSEEQKQLLLDYISEICQKMPPIMLLCLSNLNTLFPNNDVQKKNSNLKINIPIHKMNWLKIVDCSQTQIRLKPVNGCILGTLWLEDLKNPQNLQNPKSIAIKTLEEFTCYRIICNSEDHNTKEWLEKMVKIPKSPHVRNLLKKPSKDTGNESR